MKKITIIIWSAHEYMTSTPSMRLMNLVMVNFWQIIFLMSIHTKLRVKRL